MRPPVSQSLRSIAVVALLLGGGFAGASSCAGAGAPSPPRRVTLDEAVRRTLDAGSARIHAEIRGPGTADRITVTGVASLVTRSAAITSSLPDRAPVEVRMTGDGAWLRPGPDRPWVALPPEAVDVAGAAESWGGLLGRLEAAAAPARRTAPLRATLDGAPATVHLDGEGRIRRVRVDGPDGRLDLHLSDHGIAVEVHPP